MQQQHAGATFFVQGQSSEIPEVIDLVSGWAGAPG